ncbi:choice-of-anchor Q domain-containing protein, partial [Mongoliibacter ruber]
MKRTLLIFLFFTSFFASLLPQKASAQINTITFDELANNLALGKSYTNTGFTFSVNLPSGSSAQIISIQNSGFEGSMALTDNNFAFGGITRWTIRRADSEAFQFRSIFLQDGGFGSSTSGTIQGFKNGSSTGPAKAIQFNSATAGLKDYAGDPDFFDVDEVRIQAADINFNLDHFTFGPPFSPVDTDPAEVTSISLTGAPASNATSVVFSVNFNKTALNVSPDDFQLTTSGTVVGTVSSVSGSGSTYSVTVNDISGDGSLRLDLRSGTNISNANGNTGTPAFTSGQFHFVSPCFIETFEDETIGSKIFTGNGLSFSLLGNWEVSQETPFAGIGGSQKHLTNTGAGPYIITSDELITMKQLALYLSSNPSGTNPTNDGTVTVKGFNDGVERFSLTKSTGFPTDLSNNGGYFFIDFATEQGQDNTIQRIDRLEISLGGSFVYLNLDNFEWCEVGPNNPPTVANPIPNQNAVQDADFSFQFAINTFLDIDAGDVLTYSAQLVGGDPLPTWLNFDPITRTFSGTPGNADVGQIDIEVTADDGNGGSVSDTFTLIVEAVISINPSDNNILYVDKNGSGTGEGNSWANAIPELAEALRWAKENENNDLWSASAPLQIWVAGGTYKPMFSPQDGFLSTDGGRDNAFLMVKDVQVFGGFAGTESSLQEREYTLSENTSILSGDLLENDGPNFTNNDENTYHVVILPDNVGVASLDGFTITGGNANGIGDIFINGRNIPRPVGGGIFNINSPMEIRNVSVVGNFAIANGGGIYEIFSETSYTNVLISKNKSQNRAGGIFSGFCISEYTNVTVADNEAGQLGGGIYNEGSALNIQNMVLLGNTAGTSGDGLLNDNLETPESTVISFSLIQGLNSESNGNISAVGLSTDDVFEDFENGNYRLKAGSPAINTGNPDTDISLFPVGPDGPIDLGGNPRVSGRRIDMGVFEFITQISPDENNILYVQKGGRGTAEGSSWDNAIPELADALNWARENRENDLWSSVEPLQIWVAGGTYKPLFNAADGLFDSEGDRNNSFVMVRDVQLFGGFAGTEDTLEDRDLGLKENTSTLSGDLLGNDGTGFENYEDNSYHVLISAGDIGVGSLDGFTVTGGNSNGENNKLVNGRNIVRTRGAGMIMVFSSPEVRNVVFTKNTASADGGGIYGISSSANFSNVLVADNRASNGAGIYNNMGTGVFTNVTIAKNIANQKGGGIYNNSDSNTTLRNVALFGNEANDSPGIFIETGSTLTFSHSLIQEAAIETDGNISSIGLTTDDLFQDFENADFTLKIGSPLIDAGDPGTDLTLFPVGSDGAVDLDGNSRVLNGVIDIGAYEYLFPINPDENNILYVKKDGSGTGEGNSWANAIPELAEALRWAKENENNDLWSADEPLQIWVAGGTYKPMFSPQDGFLSTDGGRDNAFLMVKDVQVFGGFAGTESSLQEREYTLSENTSILSGDLLENDGPNFANNDENTYHVVILPDNVGVASLDGFTITGGNANGIGDIFINGRNIPRPVGGGIFNINSPMEIRNVSVVENFAIANGGGIYEIFSETSYTNVLISKNKSQNRAGGIFSGFCISEYTNVTVADNEAGQLGGGIYNEGSALKIQNMVLLGNTAGTSGDGLLNDNLETPESTVISFSLIQGLNNESNGNISAVGLNTDDVFEDFENGNYRLKAGSPAINTGNPDTDISLFPVGPDGPIDLGGNSRIINERIDMGAFERQQLPQTITFNSPPILTYGDMNAEFDISTTSGLPVTYTLNDNDFVSVTSNGSGLNALQATEGLIEITVSVAGNETYEATNVTVSIPVGRLQLEIAAPIISPKEFDGTTDVILELGQILNLVEGDVLQLDFTAFFDNPNAGSGKTITVQYIISGTDAANYLAPNTFISNEGVITPATITGISFENVSTVFDGTEKTLEITGTLPDGASVSYQNNTRTNAGSQDATATISGSNFNTLELSAVLEITPATIIGISFENRSFIFDGTEKTLEITGTLPDGASVSYQNNTRTNAGSQDATATISGSNFNTLELSAVLEITPATIIGISFENRSFEFDGTEKTLEITGTLPDGATVDYENNGRIVVGNQQVTARITGSNFNDLVLTAELTITPATITGITFEDDSFVFDGTEKTLEIAGTLPDGATVDYENNGRTNVGNQQVTARITGSNFNDLVLTADLTITPATITGITFEDDSFVFDGTEKTLEIAGTLPDGASVDYENNGRTNVGNQQVTARITGSNFNDLVLTAELTITPATITGITFEDDSFVFDGTEKTLAIAGTLPDGATVDYENNGRTDVGNQQVTARITSSNFNDLVLTAELIITPAAITEITFEDDSFVFDGTEKILEIAGTLPDGASVDYENNGRTNVGNQQVTARITGSNFNDLVLTAELTITPATITGITFEDDSFVFDGTEKTLEITGTLPDGVSVDYENNGRTDVGNQQVTARITGSNFNDLVLTAELEITPATITGITFEDASFVFDGTEKTLEIAGTLPDGATVDYENNGRTNVGNQQVTARITGSNFNDLVLTAELTITPTTITGITFEDDSFVFDGSEKTLEIAGTLPDGATVDYENNGRTNVGNQQVTARITGSNFNDLVLTAELTITPATITGITFEDGSFVFDETEKTIEITGTLPDGTSVAYEDNTRTNVGSQQATATISGANYNTLVLTADLTITPATITGITFEDGSFVFDESEITIEISGTLPNGTSVTYADNTRTNVGSQQATATITGANYNTLVLTAELTVTPATITGITFEDGSFVFDESEKTIEISGTLPVGTSVTYADNTRTNVGSQQATATITGANYNTLVLTAELTISPATITGITFQDGSFVFDNTQKSLAISGNLPDGTS